MASFSALDTEVTDMRDMTDETHVEVGVYTHRRGPHGQAFEHVFGSYPGRDSALNINTCSTENHMTKHKRTEVVHARCSFSKLLVGNEKWRLCMLCDRPNRSHAAGQPHA